LLPVQAEWWGEQSAMTGAPMAILFSPMITEASTFATGIESFKRYNATILT
jgi:hypothetical protein